MVDDVTDLLAFIAIPSSSSSNYLAYAKKFLSWVSILRSGSRQKFFCFLSDPSKLDSWLFFERLLFR